VAESAHLHVGYRVDDPRHPPGAHAGETGSVLPCAVESLAPGLPFPPHHDTIMTGARRVTAQAMTPARGKPSWISCCMGACPAVPTRMGPQSGRTVEAGGAYARQTRRYRTALPECLRRAVPPIPGLRRLHTRSRVCRPGAGFFPVYSNWLCGPDRRHACLRAEQAGKEAPALDRGGVTIRTRTGFPTLRRQGGMR